ncbi:MAG: 3-dehydroquinate synthase [Planctomycetota bacterium]|jgi:3-dehydroquinate synthase
MTDAIDTLELPHAGGRCPIHIGVGVLKRARDLVPALAAAGRVFLVADEAVGDTHAATLADALTAAGIAVDTAAITATEQAKRPETVTRLHEAMAAARVERGTPVLAVGGGITGDVVGFAAATWLRGVPVVQVPTTLLAMVDASIGGKTGVNLPMPGGGLRKNMVGAFWQPMAVLSDPSTLGTLERRELRCGLAECLKHGLIADPPLLERLERDREPLLAAAPEACRDLVTAAARVKVAIVAADEREAGVREHLNLGHTFAHAIEAGDGDAVRHGEAVAIGLVAAARIAVGLGRLSEDDAARIESLLESLELPVRLPTPRSADTLMEAMRLDKKVRGGRIRLVVAGPIGTAAVEDAISEAAVREAWRAVGAT